MDMMTNIQIHIIIALSCFVAPNFANPVWEDEVAEWNETIHAIPYEINTAHFTIKSTVDMALNYWWQTDDCKGCQIKQRAVIPANGNYTELVKTWYTSQIQIRDASQQVVCSTKQLFHERGDYWLIIYEESSNGNTTIACDLALYNDPPNIYLPLLWIFLILLGLAFIWIMFKVLQSRGAFERCQPNRESHDLQQISISQINLEISHSETDMDKPSNGYMKDAIQLPIKREVKVEKPKTRLRSLDTFRGFCLVVMIFVNYAGSSSYYFFSHVTWDGLYVADLVFPWFIWIMGTSMIFSMRGMRKRGVRYHKIFWRICKRTFWLFAIGIFLGSGHGVVWEMLRIPGVLQRFSITYFVVAVTHLTFGNKSLHDRPTWWSPLRDVVLFWPEWLVMLSLTALHLALTFAFVEPGCPKGYLGPGGLHAGGDTYNCTGGAAGYIDRVFFGSAHMYRYNYIKDVYETEQDHDPEGILGSITSIVMCFLGLQAGKIITAYQSVSGRVVRFCIWGILTTGIALALCKGSLDEDGWIPINKNLWSVSFILLLSGMAFVLLAAMYLIIDVWGLWSGAPLFYPGMNSIVIYACHSIFNTYLPVYWVMPDTTLHWQKLFMTSWGTAVWIIVAYIMYRKKVFIAL